MLLALGTSSTSAQESYRATHYGESYNGRTTACGTVYSSGDSTILAVGYPSYSRGGCGERYRIEGPNGTIQVTLQDLCPGCGNIMIDLSERGHELVCGVGTCTVTLIKEE